MPVFADPIRMPALGHDGEWVLFPYDMSDVNLGRPGTNVTGVELRLANKGGNGRQIANVADRRLADAVCAILSEEAYPGDEKALFEAAGYRREDPSLSFGQHYWIREHGWGRLTVTIRHYEVRMQAYPKAGGLIEIANFHSDTPYRLRRPFTSIVQAVVMIGDDYISMD